MTPPASDERPGTLQRIVDSGGALSVHVFAHREHAYPFEDAGASDWMARASCATARS